MAVINKPDMNYGLWAENGNVEIPSSEKVELGWIAEKPLNEQMNWVQNRQDAMLQYINQHGIVEWDNVTEYPINAFVAREGVVYKALSQNVDKDPTLNTAIWTVAFADFSQVDTITKITDEDGYVGHYVRKSAPVLNAVAKGVGYSGDDENKGVKFDGNDNLYVTNGENKRYDFNGTYTNDNDVIRKSDLQAILEDYTRYKIDDLYKTQVPYPNVVAGLLGLNDNTPTWTKFVNSQFGSYEHQLTEDEMPRHNHSYGSYGGMNDNKGNVMPDEPWEEGGKGSGVTLTSGGDKPHNNVQPSVVVAIWRRVA